MKLYKEDSVLEAPINTKFYIFVNDANFYATNNHEEFTKMKFYVISLMELLKIKYKAETSLYKNEGGEMHEVRSYTTI